MAQTKLTIKITTAWWLPLYIRGVAFMSVLMGCEPDWEKVRSVVKRAMRLKIE